MNIFQKSKRIKIFFILVLSLSMLGLTACGGKVEQAQKPKIMFADPGWDSIAFHNSVSRFIIENGYGYKTDVTMGSSTATLTGLRQGDIDVYMEVWKDNIIDMYNDAIEKGDFVELGTNFDDDKQGLYVPTYVIKGDPDRGIAPMAPDLKSIKDLPKYWELFKDEEDPSKGRIYGAIPGWVCDEIMRTKMKNYGLDKTYNYFSPGSDAALASSIAAAYEKGEPWVGYYWEPTWIMGKYDMTLLEDEPYSEELWKNGYNCEFRPVDITIVVNRDMPKKAPDVVEFLKNYHTDSKIISEALAYMQNNNVDADEAAKWFLKEHEEIWKKWVSDEVAQKVKEAIK
ncbi:ABC transporter substrate-binding protein [Crassaminicella thermophila]|uniref:ABC transporter substrate-binding protein n=1 Tax=Crassaminicella thermophila TaxID=2599308 RepID=A0A5C0SI85_CRATE|nr:ABC transporter substrate-binding protein [Crassaminicella thermophila]QEK13387.1 ABC transporter substrate-binding protein [Crassaminicella thermophila]